jgi:Xaa-Pro aminopeptidase
VTTDKALLWTDGRYYLQAEAELGPDWTLMRGGSGTCPEVCGVVLCVWGRGCMAAA